MIKNWQQELILNLVCIKLKFNSSFIDNNGNLELLENKNRDENILLTTYQVSPSVTVDEMNEVDYVI